MPCGSLFRQRTSRASDACRAHNQHPKLLCGRLPLTPNFHDLAKLCAGHHTSIRAWRRLCYAETKPSLRHAGHLTTLGSSSSNHERPHSQCILYMRCAVTAPNSSSWTSMPFSVAPCGGTTFRSTRRPSCGKLPGWLVRSFTAKSLTVLVISHAMLTKRQPPAQGRSTELTLVLG